MTFTKFMHFTRTIGTAAGLALVAQGAIAQDMTLRGASLFDEDHAYTKTLREFERLVSEATDGAVAFELHLNGELGDESDFVTFLQQGVAIDYAVMAPSNMAVFAPSIPLMDMPFLFRDLDHWNAVLSSDVLAPLEEQLLEKADIKIIGYAGGGTRNLASSAPVTNMDELSGHKMRVMGAPIQAQVFSALDAAPSVIAYNEVYNAIQTGVIAGFENEAAAIQNLKFYEVAPNITLTKHAITVRPLVMANKTFQKLSPELQQIVLDAGAKAGALGREVESSEDAMKLQQMADAGQVQVAEFAGREKLLDLVVPVQDAYAAELGATDLLAAIRDME
ncbi:TRAP transporter substrate-binding protein [Sagittula sp. SSi028]|uniref:TRAP transporter substrate-binding protein n=1 Tax=Sagittula sp. SSi028 TaxID=3400636 RepID=UPI003AF81843